MIMDKWCTICRHLTRQIYYRLRWQCLDCQQREEEEEKKFRKEHNLRKEVNYAKVSKTMQGVRTRVYFQRVARAMFELLNHLCPFGRRNQARA